jgi:hypothetical protein
MKIVADTERQMAAILNQLGLTPTAKDRAKPTRTTEEEKLDDFSRLFVVPTGVTEFVPPPLSAEALASLAALDAEGPEEPEEEERPNSEE